jgi:eukaryotic-like serine/threonine-protein kinase
MSTPSNRSSAPPTKAEVRGTPVREDSQGSRKGDRPSQRPGGPESLVGHVLSGRYFIERLLGEGGMGAVYQAEHTHMHKRLAVKVLHPEMSRLPEVVARFEREAMAAAHIDHPNVAAATDFGKLDDGSFFLALEYVEGQGLREALTAGRLELGRALHIVRQIASALWRAHALGIVHRDLKPENVMLVRRDDDPDFVKVLDFGIAKVPVGSLVGEHKASGQALTQLGMVYGTPEYMAPEQALGQPVDARADLYALGAMAFEMITGVRPFDHESKVTLLGMHVTAPIPSMREKAPAANVPPEIETIVTRLLAKEAGARFPDAKELIEALDSASERLAAQGRIAEAPPRSIASGPRSTGIGDREGPRAALPSSAAIAQPSKGLSSLVGASVGHAGMPARSPRGRRLLLVGLAGLGAALLVTLGVVVAPTLHQGTATPAPPASSVVVAPPPKPPDPQVDEIVSTAQAKIDKGDFATAIDELTSVEEKDPTRADVHMLLERAYRGVRNPAGEMREADHWLAVDANAASDLKLQEDIRNAALMPDAQDDAFALLESKMGMRGIDLLFDIAYGASGRLYPQAAGRARKALDLPDVRKRASPALGILLRFRDAKTCDQKHALLEEVRDVADARMISQLQPYEGTRGCGFLGRTDCYPCMHKDHLLQEAKQGITDRMARQ